MQYLSQGHLLLPSSLFTILSVNFAVYPPLFGERNAPNSEPKKQEHLLQYFVLTSLREVDIEGTCFSRTGFDFQVPVNENSRVLARL